MATKKEEINTSLSIAWPFLEMFCKTEDPFHFTSSLPLPLYSAFWLQFPIASLSLAPWKNLQPDRKKIVILRLPSSQSADIPYPNNSSPNLLACCVASWTSLDSIADIRAIYKRRFISGISSCDYENQEVPWSAVCKLETQEVWWCSVWAWRPDNQGRQWYKSKSKDLRIKELMV